MSGGHFNNGGYIYFELKQFAEELEREIENNEIPDEWGCCTSYDSKVLNVLKRQISQINRIADIMKAIDYLYSGDYGEDTFLESIKKIEEEDQK